MQEIAVFSNGRVTNEKAVLMLKSIADGRYIIDVVPLYPKTSEQNRNLFFYNVGLIAGSIGDKPDDLYKLFKEEMKIESLKGDLSVEEWFEVNRKFKDYVWRNLEIIL